MNSVTDIFALATALFGAICLMTWSLFKTRASMLTVQLGIGVSFGLHYAILGAETAAVGNAISALQVLLSLIFSNDPRLRWIGYMPIPLMLVLGVLTWNGSSSLLATTGTIVIAFGRMELNEQRLRKWVLVGTCFWLVHDVLLWSPIAIIDVISLAIGCLALLRIKPGLGSGAGDRGGGPRTEILRFRTRAEATGQCGSAFVATELPRISATGSHASNSGRR